MSERYSLGWDAWGQVHEYLEFDEDGMARVVWSGDNVHQMNANHEARNDGTNGFTQSREMRKIIELDPASVMTIATIHGVKPLTAEFDDLVLRLARDGDWKNIRTVDGGIKRRMVD